MERAQLELAQDAGSKHEVFISAKVIVELSAPDYPIRDAALDFTVGIELLPIDEEVLALGQMLVDQRVMPGPLKGDSIHVAVAAYHGAEYLLSWNVKHLANPRKRIHLAQILMSAGKAVPAIVTPDVLWEEEIDG